MQRSFIGEDQLSLDTQSQSYIAVRDMAAAQSDGDRSLEIFKHAQNHLFKQMGGRPRRHTIQHLAEDNAAHAGQLARLAQLPQHSVHL